MGEAGLTIWTIGHSTRDPDVFIALLKHNAIKIVADVRRFPGSRRHPAFGRDALSARLETEGIAYIPLPELGGRRRPRADTRNTIWRNLSFRGYADYMESDEFRAGIERLLAAARRGRTAIMCAEALWWRCHRALIADYLKADGSCVKHIMDGTAVQVHPYTSAARIVNGRLTYVAEA